ncbi:MAG: hypothetical protein NTZ35_16985 [Ignavibacteriales bacterium]|nr:hypothetical protein [Ignavibacteriales bacterium]
MNSSANPYNRRKEFGVVSRTALLGFVLMCFLSFLGTEAIHAQPTARVDSILALVQELYEQGSYLSSEVEARRLLENRSLPDSMRVRAEQYLAFSLVAQAKNAAAVDHMVTILRIDSTFTLDPILTSPKILSVFAEARKQYENVKLSEHSPLQLQQRLPDRGVTFRTVLFPGWEQAYQGRSVKGYALMSAGVVTLGAMIYFDRERRSAEEEYLAANTPELASSRYTRYNNYHKAEYYSLAAFLAIYVYSQFDAFFDLPPHLNPAVSQSNSNVQVTLHFPL